MTAMIGYTFINNFNTE